MSNSSTAGAAPKNPRTWPWLGLAAVLLMMLAMVARKADEPLREYGAGRFQDPEWLLAGERFEKDGLIKTRAVPLLQIGPLEEAPLGKEYPYLHGYVLHFAVGKVLRVLGIQSLAGFRLWAACVYALGVVCFFWLVAQATGNRWLALLAASLLAFSNPLYAHADSVAWYSQVPFFVFAPLALWMYSVRRPDRRTWAWWGVGILLALQCQFVLITAYALYSQAFFWLFALLVGIPWPKRQLLWLLGGHAAGVGLVLARNAWHFGLKNTLIDITAAVVWRISNVELPGLTFAREELVLGMVPDWNLLTYLGTIINRLSRTFVGFRGVIGLTVFLALLAVALYRIWKLPALLAGAREKKFRRAFLFGLALLLASVPFALIFMQNVVTHHFTGVDYIPGVAVLLAVLVWRLSWTRRKLAAALACVFVLASVADCLRKEIQRPGHYGETAKIGSTLPHDAVVGMSSHLPVMAYYVHRPFVRSLETVEQVEEFHQKARVQFPGRPLYFVLTPTAVAPYEPLRMHLDSHYSFLMEVQSTGPTRVYELNAPLPH
jgi:hypothetical protein